MINADFNRKEAVLIRVLSGSKIEETLYKAVKILGENGIPTLVIGGYAVQEYGYPRFTKDADIVVPSVIKSVELLHTNGFKTKSGEPNVQIDSNGAELDVLQAGKRINDSKVPLPTPSEVVTTPKLISLPELIDLKLSSFASAMWQRAKDLSDVSELIQRNSLPREFMVGGIMEDFYMRVWDGLQADKEGKPSDPNKLASVLPLGSLLRKRE